MNKRKATLIILLFITLALFLACWAGSFAKCEYLTWKYGDQFDGIDLYYQHTMLAPYDYLKVLKYNSNTAAVYYVQRGEGGDILYFERENENADWCFTYWETIWSRTGSASEFVWPYIR